MSNREVVFHDLENKFKKWLTSRGTNGKFAAADHYAANLKAIGEAVQPHDKPGSAWFGLIEQLLGKKPTVGVYEVSSLEEFSANYGEAVSLFSFEKKAKDQIRPLYPKCLVFDEIFSFLFSDESGKRGDGGHTRSAFIKYCQFLCEQEAQITRGPKQKEETRGVWSLQKIVYGAPGTGKSQGIETELIKHNVDPIRVTFHPDSDYASFVGCYKPFMKPVQRVNCIDDKAKDVTDAKGNPSMTDEIVYEFRPQAFTNAYVEAWKKMAAAKEGEHPAPQVLVIEEINRGDCAKIFGDLFQLLDRDKDTGFSTYPIVADQDLVAYLNTEFKAAGLQEQSPVGSLKTDVWNDVKIGKKLVLPPNLYIWATMNTSDQSLFPMDSAFKRRWDWKYVPIRNHKEEGWGIEVDATHRYDWWEFLRKINETIFKLTSSEDKQLGYFFVQAKDKVVSLDTFVNKVVFYLWNTVFKDCYTDAECAFLKDGDDYLHFGRFFDDAGDLKPASAKKMLEALGLKAMPVNAASPAASSAATGGQPVADNGQSVATGEDSSASSTPAEEGEEPSAEDAPAADATEAADSTATQNP